MQNRRTKSNLQLLLGKVWENKLRNTLLNEHQKQITMNKLIQKLEEEIQSHGYQCINIKDVADYRTKLDCMGGSYKGFLMTEELNNFCLFYIDTEKMEKEAFAKQNKLPQYRFRTSESSAEYVNSLPETFVERCTSGYYQECYHNEYTEAREEANKGNILTRLKNLFK